MRLQQFVAFGAGWPGEAGRSCGRTPEEAAVTLPRCFVVVSWPVRQGQGAGVQVEQAAFGLIVGQGTSTARSTRRDAGRGDQQVGRLVASTKETLCRCRTRRCVEQGERQRPRADPQLLVLGDEVDVLSTMMTAAGSSHWAAPTDQPRAGPVRTMQVTSGSGRAGSAPRALCQRRVVRRAAMTLQALPGGTQRLAAGLFRPRGADAGQGALGKDDLLGGDPRSGEEADGVLGGPGARPGSRRTRGPGPGTRWCSTMSR